MRFQFVILKIITLLLNSGVTAANLPNLPPNGPHPILLKFPKRLYLLKLQVGPVGLSLLFFPDKTPNSNGKNDHSWSSFLALKCD
ncbi:hypothetical protein ACJW31_11G156400 [Castanea mollissima]